MRELLNITDETKVEEISLEIVTLKSEVYDILIYLQSINHQKGVLETRIGELSALLKNRE